VTRVVLLTDFGTADGYAAAMAGVVAAGAPGAVLEHATHDIAPGDLLGAAIALYRFASRYPPGTVHLVVVDPGVGTDRRPLAATLDHRHYVAPDNGVLSLVLRDAVARAVVTIENVGLGDRAAPTFHGRDIFAPAAAHLARGEPLAALGPPLHDPVELDLPEPRRTGDAIRGEVLHVDRFGTLITNIPASWIQPTGAPERAVEVTVAGRAVGPLRRTYGDVASHESLALIGSLGLLEVSVRDGHAAALLDAGRGAAVHVTGAAS
jgi:S-adenosyl-L-methionine hydrolase (adenosine-forming)